MGFVIGQMGIISKESILKLHKFRRRIMGRKDMHSSYKRGLLVSKMLNVTLKGSLNIYRWFVSSSPTPPWQKRGLPSLGYVRKLNAQGRHTNFFRDVRGTGEWRSPVAAGRVAIRV